MDDNILKRLGARIREERKKAGLTQEKLAEKAGLSVDYIGYIERGKQAPYIKTLERIAKILEVQVFELFIFQEKEMEVEKEKAIKGLVLSVRNKGPEDISFITSTLMQIFEWTEKRKRVV